MDIRANQTGGVLMNNLTLFLKEIARKIPIIRAYRTRKVKEKIVFQYFLTEKQISDCMESETSKQRVVAGWEKQHPEKAAELNQRIDRTIQRGSLPDSETLRLEMKFLFSAYGYTPNEYLSYGFSSKSYDEINSFISDRQSVLYGYSMNHLYAMNVFMDKWRTYERFQPYFHRECAVIESEKDYSAFDSFAQKHPVFVKKDVFESCGRGVELVDLSKEASMRSCFERLRTSRKVMLEEVVHQSGKLAALNQSSVNTVRCFTLKLKKGIIVPWAFMKVGRNGSFVDNGGAGGLLVGIDSETGVFNTDGVDEYGYRYEKHPDTGITFQGFSLPEWDHMIALCKEMAAMEPNVPWIGWDMAHTEDGWVVIEGNPLSEAIGPQSTMQKGIKDELERYIARM